MPSRIPHIETEIVSDDASGHYTKPNQKAQNKLINIIVVGIIYKIHKLINFNVCGCLE